MAGWIFTVDQKYPQHVDYAVEHRFWDTTKQFAVQAGDDVFLWLNGHQRLAAHFVATSSLGPMGPEPQPWDDASVRTYRHRIYLELVSRDVLRSPSWPELQEIIGNRQFANTAAIAIKRADAAEALGQMFATVDVAWAPRIELGIDFQHPNEGYPDLPEVPVDEDAREAAVRAVVVRRGQPTFRKRLLENYHHCLVTRWRVADVLEAAHISPYRGTHTNKLNNGLLLRADIHTLFDLNLLTVTPDYEIHVAPRIRETPYGGFHGDSLTFPTLGDLRPDGALLQRHNANCPWL